MGMSALLMRGVAPVISSMLFSVFHLQLLRRGKRKGGLDVPSLPARPSVHGRTAFANG